MVSWTILIIWWCYAGYICSWTQRFEYRFAWADYIATIVAIEKRNKRVKQTRIRLKNYMNRSNHSHDHLNILKLFHSPSKRGVKCRSVCICIYIYMYMSHSNFLPRVPIHVRQNHGKIIRVIRWTKLIKMGSNNWQIHLLYR